MQSLESMSDFFTARVDGYDEHMLSNVEGCAQGYAEMASLVPNECETLLDLGCGTGLELDEIFKRFPAMRVTGIDLTQAMLDKLRQKHPDADMKLICSSYFDVPLGRESFDCAASFQTMHHFSHEVKLGLYSRIFDAVKSGGSYIECDYMVERQQEEDRLFAENSRIRRELGIPEDAFYHFDTPCTVDNQIMLLKRSGFSSVENVFRIGNTTILVASK